MLDYIILGIVLNEELTGYDIKKHIEFGIGNFYKASYGNLYPALKKLADKDFLTMKEQPQGERNKKYYQATELGKSAFLEWLSSPTDFSSSYDALMVKIFFYGELPDDIRRERIYECELFMQQHLRELREIEEQFASTINNDRDYFEISTLYYGIQSLLNSLRWLRHIKEKKPFSEFVQENGK